MYLDLIVSLSSHYCKPDCPWGIIYNYIDISNLHLLISLNLSTELAPGKET